MGKRRRMEMVSSRKPTLMIDPSELASLRARNRDENEEGKEQGGSVQLVGDYSDSDVDEREEEGEERSEGGESTKKRGEEGVSPSSVSPSPSPSPSPPLSSSDMMTTKIDTFLKDLVKSIGPGLYARWATKRMARLEEIKAEVKSAKKREKLEEKKKKLKLKAEAGEWRTCVDASSGDTYYWRTTTNETTWEKPLCLQLAEEDGVEGEGSKSERERERGGEGERARAAGEGEEGKGREEGGEEGSERKTEKEDEVDSAEVEEEAMQMLKREEQQKKEEQDSKLSVSNQCPTLIETALFKAEEVLSAKKRREGERAHRSQAKNESGEKQNGGGQDGAGQGKTGRREGRNEVEGRSNAEEEINREVKVGAEMLRIAFPHLPTSSRAEGGGQEKAKTEEVGVQAEVENEKVSESIGTSTDEVKAEGVEEGELMGEVGAQQGRSEVSEEEAEARRSRIQLLFDQMEESADLTGWNWKSRMTYADFLRITLMLRKNDFLSGKVPMEYLEERAKNLKNRLSDALREEKEKAAMLGLELSGGGGEGEERRGEESTSASAHSTGVSEADLTSGQWQRMVDPATSAVYYYHLQTGETMWEGQWGGGSTSIPQQYSDVGSLSHAYTEVERSAKRVGGGEGGGKKRKYVMPSPPRSAPPPPPPSTTSSGVASTAYTTTADEDVEMEDEVLPSSSSFRTATISGGSSGGGKKRAAGASQAAGKEKVKKPAKVTSMISKWKSKQEEMEREESLRSRAGADLTEKEMEEKRELDIRRWKQQEINSGKAAKNPNFQPLGYSHLQQMYMSGGKK